MIVLSKKKFHTIIGINAVIVCIKHTMVINQIKTLSHILQCSVKLKNFKSSSLAMEPLESVRFFFPSKYQCSKSQPEQEPVAMDQICN